jgi:hypothetical protein
MLSKTAVIGASCALAAILFMFGTTPVSAQQNDIARSLCAAHMSLIDIVIGMRMNGIPISIAEDAVGSTYNIDPRLYAIMRATVRLAYSDPSQLQSQASSDQWLRNCASYVRGY